MGNFILSAFADEIDSDLEIQMDVLEEHGISYIEMRGVDGKGVVNYPLSEAEKIKKRLDDRGFKISAIGSPLGKIGINDEFGPHLELFRHTVKMAQILETKYIRMFSFFIPKGENPEKYREEVLQRWLRFADEADGSGLILCHENEKDIYGDTAERCLDLMESIGCEYVRAVFDPANFIQCGEETYPKAFKMLRHHVEYLHIKDALSCDGSVVPSGMGDGHIREILGELYGEGYEGFLSLEPHLGSFKGFADLEKDTDTSSMPDSGPGKFDIAVKALLKIIGDIKC